MTKQYRIKKGEQLAFAPPHLHLGCKRVKKMVILDSSCLYDQTEPGCAFEINRITGISYGLFHPEIFTLGWRCLDSQTLELIALTQKAEGTSVKVLMQIMPDKEYVLEIEYNKKAGLIIYSIQTFNNKKYIYGVPYQGCAWPGFILYPKFGKVCPAPKTMTLMMEHL